MKKGDSVAPPLFVGCLTPQQHASVSLGRICSDNCTCCHTEIEVADQTFHLTQSQYTDTGPTGPRAEPISPGVWQGIHCSTYFEVTDMTRHGKFSTGKVGIEPGFAALKANTLTTRPKRRHLPQAKDEPTSLPHERTVKTFV